MEETRKRSPVLLWIIGGVLLLLVLPICGLMVVGASFLVVRQEPQSVPTPIAVVRQVEPRAAVISVPTPPVIVATPEGGRDYETAVLENIYREVNPSVVNVTVLSAAHVTVPDDQLPPGMDPDELLPFSSGSGFVWDLDGHIVTNNHVVDGADEVQIIFSNGTVAIAEVMGSDVDADLAVLQIDPEGYELVPVRLGRMEDVAVGMRVAAIGNPFGLEGTLTSGIVSAIGRSIPARERFSIPDAIQTDAAINPGNSGGPLLNEQGEVIGVNAQIRSEVRANSGVGFAIPISLLERVVPALIETGVYQHSYMGVSGGTLSPLCADELGLPKELRGAIIGQVISGTPADRAGLQGGTRETHTRYPGICPSQRGGDVIVAIDGQSVSRFDDVLAYLQRNTSPGDTVVLTIWRNEETLEVELTLAPRPDSIS